METEGSSQAQSPEVEPVRQPVSPWTHFTSAILFAALLLPLLLLGSGCYGLCSSYSFGGGAGQLRVAAAPNGDAHLFLDVSASGVLTPAQESRLILDGQREPSALDLAAFAAQGYVAVRVPHAPPSYTASSLLAGFRGGGPGASFSYFYPSNSRLSTTVPVTLTRRTELETLVDARFPITDGKSHWEVWWLPAGNEFPIPDGPFRLESDSTPPVQLQFRADFGEDPLADCNGCDYEYLAFDGVSFFGPFAGKLVYEGPIGVPYAIFGTGCAHETPPIPTTASLLLLPGQTYTFTYCLENHDSKLHTFRVTADSTQDWAYSFYTQTVGSAAAPVLVGDAPFLVTVPPNLGFGVGRVAIHAVYTPSFEEADSVQEALQLHAAATDLRSMTASGTSFGFSAQFDPQAGAQRTLYLPTIMQGQ